MPFFRLESLPEREMGPGLFARFLHTGNMTIAYWRINAGAVLPAHSHPHEQVATLLTGEFELTVGEETRLLSPGDAAVVSPDVVHSGSAVQDCTIIDVFHPVREDYR